MRTIVFIVYAIGALIGAVSFGLVEPIPALVVTLGAPFVLLFLLERFGIVRFQVYHPQPPDSLIYKSGQEKLTDQQAADKYGWGIIREMDNAINDTHIQLANMHTERERFASMVKGEQK